MAYGSVHCPQCGLKSNLRESSVGTMRRCQNCGHKFVIEPARFSLGGCVAGILALVGISAVGLVACCGVVGWIGATPTVVPPRQAPQAKVAAQAKATVQAASEPKETSAASELPTAVEADMRTWTSSDGKFTTEAAFAGSIAGNVKLKKSDGTIITLASEKLSESDREWIRKRAGQAARQQ